MTIFLTIGWLLVHAVGIAAAVDSLFSTRSSQATIAWGLCLLLFPFVTVPLYLIFGRRRQRAYRRLCKRFSNYAALRESSRQKSDAATTELTPIDLKSEVERVLESIAGRQFTTGNKVKFLTSGKSFYEALLKDINAAQHHVFLCFYVVNSDNIGERLAAALAGAKSRGVEVKFLYDRIGSFSLTRRYCEEFALSGVEFTGFNTERSWRSCFHANFRNHRKIAVIDNRVAYVGGFNVGDEYLGLSEAIGAWRDTQLSIEGVAVNDVAAIFRNDWELATGTKLEVKNALAATGFARALVLDTGPTDSSERAVLYLLEMILAARKRLWISSPYFVPSSGIMSALGLCVARGVDVRIIIPDRGDNPIVQWASLYYADLAQMMGIKMYQYTAGFIHQKAWLVDSSLATVTTANLDNRSLHLNFEIGVTLADELSSTTLAAIFEDDFQKSTVMRVSDISTLSFPERVARSFSRLFGPLL